MRRREFISLLGSTAAAWPIAARAQQAAMPVIGFLDSGSPETNNVVVNFRQGLADSGYVEGKNVVVEYRWANGKVGALRWLANELVERRVNVIVASGAIGSALAAKAATSTIPIVIASGADPVKYGLVASLARPGANVTGMTVIHSELAGKRLEIMRDLVPDATTVAYLTSDLRDRVVREDTDELLAVARQLGRQVIVLECRSDADLDRAFSAVIESDAGALVVEAFATAFNARDKIVALAARHKIPTIYPQTQYAYAGGLMSYTAATTLRELAVLYVAPILKGAKPADLPVQRPIKFRLVINLRTAKALGLTVPDRLLAIADEVIE
jgi:putative tryptophan/tyrosine transport system substrate-binding protein